jgi:hypothetical protein
MCYLLSTSQRIRLVQRETATHRSASLLGPMGVLFPALPQFLFNNHEKNGGTHDRRK